MTNKKHHPSDRAQRLALERHKFENKEQAEARKGKVRRKLALEHVKEREAEDELRTVAH